MNPKGTDIDNYKDNDKIFRFPYFNTSLEYEKIKLAEDKKNFELQKLLDPKNNNFVIGRNVVFDSNAFNYQYAKIINTKKEKRLLKEKKRLLKLNEKPINYDKLTIEELKQGLFVDFFDMCNELINSNDSIDFIMSKNYRKLTILVLTLIIMTISYTIILFLNN